jgi:hypothetical protein
VDDLLGLPEQGAKIPFSGLVLYTLSMPTMVLTNISTPAGLVNGATGKAVGVVVDPEGESPLTISIPSPVSTNLNTNSGLSRT